MDPTEDVSARVLLTHILSTEPTRTPIARRTAQTQHTSTTRRSERLSKKDAQTPQDILRRSLRHKIRESITRQSLPATNRRTASVLLKRINTPASTSLLFDDGDTPRHALMNILRTEPVKSPMVHEKASSEDTQSFSADSSVTRKRPSIELSGLDFPDITIGNTASIEKGLNRKRPRRSLNVTAFEKRLKDGEDFEEQNEESESDHSSLSLSSSTSFSLKTPFVNVQTERKGLQRRVSNRRKITAEEFGAAVNKRQMGGVSSFVQVEQGLSETAYSEDFTLGISKLSEPDITTDILHCNTALYAQPDAMTSNFSIVATQDKPTVMASQLQIQMEQEEQMEEEQGKLGKEKSTYAFPTEEGAEPQNEECVFPVEEDANAAEYQKEQEKSTGDDQLKVMSQEEEGIAESQTSVEDDRDKSEEENRVAATTGAGDFESEEEQGAADFHTEEDVTTRSEEEESAADSQTEEEQGGVSSQHEEDVAARSQSEEEDVLPDSQTEEQQGGVSSQHEEDVTARSQSEEEESAADSQTEEEQGGDSSQHEEDVAARSQSEEEDVSPDSQTEEEQGGVSSQYEEDVAARSQSEEEDVSPDSQTEGEDAVHSQTEEEGAVDLQSEEDVEEYQSDQEYPATNYQSEEEDDLADSQPEDEHDGKPEEEDGELEPDLEHISGRAHHSEGGPMPVTEARGNLEEATEAAHSSLEMGSRESGPLHIEIPDLTKSSTQGKMDASYAEAEPDADKENSFNPPEAALDIEDSRHLSEESPEEVAGQDPAEQEEEWEEDEDDEESDEIPSKTPAFVKQKIHFIRPDPLASPTVFKKIQASSSTGAGIPSPKQKKVRQKRGPTKKEAELPKTYLMSVFRHFAKAKVSADVYPVLREIMDKYFDRLAEDLETFAAHAKRKTIEVEDVELLLKRQGYVNDKVPVEVLIEKYLRMDQRKLLIPIASSGNVVIPKERR